MWLFWLLLGSAATFVGHWAWGKYKVNSLLDKECIVLEAKLEALKKKL